MDFRRTPGRFRTRVIADGVVPSLRVDYKKTRIKQYHKEGQALRTETTINDTRENVRAVRSDCMFFFSFVVSAARRAQVDAGTPVDDKDYQVHSDLPASFQD